MHLQQEANLADTLSPNERRRLALDALTAERSVLRAYREPHRVRESTWLRVHDAAARLGLPVPPQRAAESAPKFDQKRAVADGGPKVAIWTTTGGSSVAAVVAPSEQPSNSPLAGCEVPSKVRANVSGASSRRELASNPRRTHRQPASKSP
jgi:hypothetical protein